MLHTDASPTHHTPHPVKHIPHNTCCRSHQFFCSFLCAVILLCPASPDIHLLVQPIWWGVCRVRGQGSSSTARGQQPGLQGQPPLGCSPVTTSTSRWSPCTAWTPMQPSWPPQAWRLPSTPAAAPWPCWLPTTRLGPCNNRWLLHRVCTHL